jgi:DNA-binding NarL/FixJ family response regulator
VISLVIVDDHEMVREGLRSILASESDMKVVGEAASADGLVSLVEETKPDVILLDAHLPGVTGPDACRQLTQRYPELRVLIVSTSADDELLRDCVAAGAHGYVIKDIGRVELREAVRAVYRGEGAVSPSVAGRLLDHMRTGLVRSATPVLNDGQLRILKLVSEGYSNREIACNVHLSENTVKSHLRQIFRKLDVRNRVEAALRASREGWV